MRYKLACAKLDMYANELTGRLCVMALDLQGCGIGVEPDYQQPHRCMSSGPRALCGGNEIDTLLVTGMGRPNTSPASKDLGDFFLGASLSYRGWTCVLHITYYEYLGEEYQSSSLLGPPGDSLGQRGGRGGPIHRTYNG